MDLVLWRHAEAEPGVPDEARHLTPLGLKQAKRVAAWLDQRLPASTRVIASPALRAQQTAQALGRKFESSTDVGTAANVDALLDVAQWLQAEGVVLVVGHQPTLGRVVSWLVDGERDERMIGTGDVVWLTNDGEPGHPVRIKHWVDGRSA